MPAPVSWCARLNESVLLCAENGRAIVGSGCSLPLARDRLSAGAGSPLLAKTSDVDFAQAGAASMTRGYNDLVKLQPT